MTRLSAPDFAPEVLRLFESLAAHPQALDQFEQVLSGAK